MSAHDYVFPGLVGGEIRLKDFAGKAVLIVNVASQCGLTPQYTDLEALHVRYRDRGLVVLGVPSNDFGAQEPGTAGEIKQFCETRYGVSFALAAKSGVIGPQAHPFYRWIVEEAGEAAAPRWNFHKYLIGKDGALVEVFGSRVPPLDRAVTDAIEAALA